MADDAAQSTTPTGGGATGRVHTLADLPDRSPRHVSQRLPAEQGERIAALVQKLRGGRGHIAVESTAASTASYAGLEDSGGNVAHEAAVRNSAAAPGVSSSTGKARFAALFRESSGDRDHLAVEFCAANYAGLYADDAVVGIPVGVDLTNSAPAPLGVPSSAGNAHHLAVDDKEEEHGEDNTVAQARVPGSKPREVQEEEEGEGDMIDRLSDFPDDVLADIRKTAITSGFDLDRLSDLPDDVICSILALVPLVEAVRTSILGRRWRQVWTKLPSLHFDDLAAGGTGVTSFLRFVDEVLARYSDIKIKRFILTISDPENVDGSRLAAWSAQAAELVSDSICFELDLAARFLQHETMFEMPGQARAEYISICISHPEQIVFSVRLTASSKFTQLRHLVLAGTRFRTDSETSIRDVVSKCPSLQKLRLEDVRGIFQLCLISSSLTELAAVFVTDLNEMKITASSLNHLHVEYSFVGKEGTALSLGHQNLKEVVWFDTCPVNTHLGELGKLEKLSIHRQQNPENLKKIVSLFSFRTLYVNVSVDEDLEQAKAEVDCMRKRLHCEIVFQVSNDED